LKFEIETVKNRFFINYQLSIINYFEWLKTLFNFEFN